MSEDIDMFTPIKSSEAFPEASDLVEDNVGFTFLCNQEEVEGSAAIRLQWCIAPQILNYFRKRGALDSARVLIDVQNVAGETVYRQISPINTPQIIIEFGGVGRHTITGFLMEGIMEDITGRIRRSWLNKEGEKYDHRSLASFDFANDTYIGKAVLQIKDVPARYFAPQPSPLEDWYLSLMLPKMKYNGCQLKYRRLFVYIIQTFLVMPLIPFLCILRGLVALLCGILQKDIAWSVVAHPFSTKFSDLFKTSSWRLSEEEWAVIIALWIMFWLWSKLSVLIGEKAGLISEEPGSWVLYGTGLATLVCLVALVFLLVFSTSSLKKLLLPAILRFQKGREMAKKRRMAQEEKRMGAIREKRRKKMELRRIAEEQQFQELCAELSCATAPEDGSLRNKKRGIVRTLVLTYQELKVAHCKPARTY